MKPQRTPGPQRVFWLLAVGLLFNVPSPAVFGGETNSVLDRLSVRVTPEIRSTYLSLGKIVEDRPMQLTSVRLGFDLGPFGRLGMRNWDVSSLTGRRQDAHRRCLYHTEFGPTWEYDLALAEGWKLHNDFTVSWTIYDGFTDAAANKLYRWWQIEQALNNPYLVPFYRLRRCVEGSDYVYCRLGLRRKFPVWRGLYLTPEVTIDGGNDRNQNRVFGRKADGESVGTGFYTISPRLELGYALNGNFTFYAWVEQYEVMGSEARGVNARYSYKCAHNDWTHGGVGLRLSF